MKRTTDLQLAGTTKRTIAENEQMLGELRYQARESAATARRAAPPSRRTRAPPTRPRGCVCARRKISPCTTGRWPMSLRGWRKGCARNTRRRASSARWRTRKPPRRRNKRRNKRKAAPRWFRRGRRKRGRLSAATKRRRGRTRSRVARRAPPRARRGARGARGARGGGGNARREKIRNPRYEGKPRRVSARLRFRPGRARPRRGLRGVAAAAARRRRRTPRVARGARRGEWRENARGDVPTGRLVRIARRYRT